MKNSNFIPIAEPDLSGNEKRYLNECFDSGWISSKGNYILKFEKLFAKYIGAKFAIATSNGTSALHLSIHALGIGPGDEVIIPDLTFIATANIVAYTGAKVILVDVLKSDGNIDTDQIEKAVTNRTKAIIPVHLYGKPADMKSILKLAKKYNLLIIEDAAEAHGAKIHWDKKGWKKVGSLGDVGCFSFYGNKIITTGEGGMIVTNNEKLALKMQMLRDHGQQSNKRYYYPKVGFNYRMTNLQAAIGVAQLERIQFFIRKKREIATHYNKLFKDIEGVKMFPVGSDTYNVFWMYCILIDKPYKRGRDELMQLLANEKIETRPFFYPLHTLPPYRAKGLFPQSNYLSKCGLNLPSAVTLSISDIERVASAIKKYSL